MIKNGRCVIVCCLLSVTAALTAQVPQFRSRVELVHLDVSVLDDNRRPVKGLTADDFTIFEDGKPQSVAVFNAVDLLDPPAPSTAWLRDVAPDVKRNTDVVDRRLIAIVMDDATIPFDQVMLKSAREIGRQVVERLGPNDLAAIVFTRDNRNAQEFTNDRTRLLKAIDAFAYGGRTIGLPKPSEGAVPPGLIYAESSGFLATVGTLTGVAESLAEVPQRRKALIYIGVGVPASGAASSEIAMVGNPEDPTTEIGAIARQLMDRLSQTYRKAALSNVNIYTVSPAGVGGMEQLIQSERWKGRIIPPYESSMNYNEFLVGLAENTGGRAFPERNEFATALAQVFAENGSYYLLGYSPSNAAQDGRQRRLEVKVNRPDVQVRTRSGYFAEKPRDAENAAAAPPPPLTAALAGLLPKTEVGLTATAAAFAIPGKSEAGVIVVLTIDQEAAARTARTREVVDLQVNAFSQEGVAKGATRYETAVTLRAGPAEPISYEVLTSLALRPGRYQLRLSTHVGSQGKTGSVYYDLDVPDFTARALSISGLLVTSDVKPVSTDADRIRQYVPIVPTAKRTFRVNEHVSVFARIYQGGPTSAPAPVNTRSQTRTPATQGVPVQVTVTVTDAEGMVRVRRTEQLARDAFGATDGAADFSLDLPLQNLPPGEYLFTLDAAGGRGQAVRHLRFAVQ